MAIETKKKADVKEIIPLSEIIDAIRSDLLESDHSKNPNFKPLFNISGVKIETEVLASNEIEAEGKLKLYAVQMGATGKQLTGTKIKISFDLNPCPQAEDLGPLIRGSKRQKTARQDR